jgi:hypothetical protein
MASSKQQQERQQEQLTVCPIDAPILFHKSGKDKETRKFYYSSLNLKWDDDCQWNVYLGDVIAVRVTDTDADHADHEHEGGNVNNNNDDDDDDNKEKINAPQVTKKSLLEWNPFHDLHPKKRGTKSQAKSTTAASSSSSSSSCKWRLGLVLALGQDLPRIAANHDKSKTKKPLGGGSGTSTTATDNHFLYVQWLHRATDTKFATNLQATFRPYRPSDKVVQLPYILLSTSEHAKIAPHSILPATIDMLTKDQLGKGVNMEDQNERNLNSDWDDLSPRHSFQLWKLAFHCPKRIDEHSTTVVPEEENGDLWSSLSASTSLVSLGETTATTLSQVPIPKPLRRGWDECQYIHDDSGLLTQNFRKGFLAAQVEKQRQQKLEAQRLQDAAEASTSSSSSSSLSATPSGEGDVDKENDQATTRTTTKVQGTDKKKRKNNTVAITKGKRSKLTADGRKPITTKSSSKRNTSENQSKEQSDPPAKNSRLAGIQANLNPQKACTSVVKTKSTMTKKKRLATTKLMASSGKHSVGAKSNKTSANQKTHSNGTTTRPSSSDRFVDSAGVQSLSSIVRGPRPLSEQLPYRSSKFQYYDAVELDVNVDALHHALTAKAGSRWTVSVGDVIPINFELEEEDGNTKTLKNGKEWYPFLFPWSGGQVIALFYNRQSEDWHVSVRWLYRFHELPQLDKEALEKIGVVGSKLSPSSMTLFELCGKGDVQDYLLETAFPGHIVMTSSSSELNTVANKPMMVDMICCTREDDGLPELPALCQYIKKGVWSRTSDWTDYNLHRSSPVPKPTLAAPLLRGLESLGRVKKQSVVDSYVDRLTQGEIMPLVVQRNCPERKTSKKRVSTPSTEDESEDDTIVAYRSGSCVFERQGMRFFDGVDVEVGANTLDPSFSYRPSGSNFWTVRVGDVVPIRLVSGPRSNWYPFLAPWSPAQVVNIYQEEIPSAEGSNNKRGYRWMMEVRWFEQFQTVPHELRTKLDQRRTDQHHVIFETEHYDQVEVSMAFPGRVVVTSSGPVSASSDIFRNQGNGENDYWEVVPSSDGIPLIPRLCELMIIDEEIEESRDWTNYNLNISLLPPPPPLVRGLQLRPRNRKGSKDLILDLWRCYKRCIRARKHDDDEGLLRKWWIKKEDIPSMELDQTRTFCPDKVIVRFGPALCISKTTFGEKVHILEFAYSVQLSMVLDHYAKPPRRPKQSKEDMWEINVGDVVCYANEHAKPPTCGKALHGGQCQWNPFSVKWSYGQVLAIYRDASTAEGEATNGTLASPVRLELRLLHRTTELPRDVEEWTPPGGLKHEDVFETDETITLDASNLVGPADLYLGFHTKICNPSSGTINKFLPTVSCQCQYFYVAGMGRFQPLSSSEFESTPAQWNQRFVERGLFHCSKLIKQYESIRTEMKSKLALKRSSLEFSSPPKQGCINSALRTVLSTKPRGKILQRNYYTSISLASSGPTSYVLPGVFPTKGQGGVKPWLLCVGRVIAATAKKGSGTFYPFLAPWIPCQVLAIFSDSKSDVDEPDGAIVVEVRVLSTKLVGDFGTHSLSELIASEQPSTERLGVADILGPLTLFPIDGNSCEVWRSIERHLPMAPVLVNGNSFGPKYSREALKSILRHTHHYSDGDIDRLISELIGDKADAIEATSANVVETSQLFKPGGWISVAPFHIDASSLRAFYSELHLIPDYNNFSNQIKEDKEEPWRVSMGDIVAIRTGNEAKPPAKSSSWDGKRFVPMRSIFSTPYTLTLALSSQSCRSCLHI